MGGAPAMTTRGCGVEEFQQIAGFLDRCCQIAVRVQAAKGKKLKDFEEGLKGDAELEALRSEVNAWASNQRSHMPGKSLLLPFTERCDWSFIEFCRSRPVAGRNGHRPIARQSGGCIRDGV